MFSFRYRFYPKHDDAEEFYGGVLSSFLGMLYGNGQILGDWNIVQAEDCLEFAGIAPAEDSLKSELYTPETTEIYDLLCEESIRKPELNIVGQCVGLEKNCSCESPSSYLLFTTFLNIEPPVLCTDCQGRVPVYKLPPDERTRYGGILSWESKYKVFDELCIQPGAGSRLAWREVSNLKSETSVEGLRICSELSEKTGKPFYYYIQTSSDRLLRKCPSCGEDWVRDEAILDGARLQCDRCRLVSFGP